MPKLDAFDDTQSLILFEAGVLRLLFLLTLYDGAVSRDESIRGAYVGIHATKTCECRLIHQLCMASDRQHDLHQG